MESILSITLPFFFLVLTGYGAGRQNIINEAGIAGLTRFIFYFALPAMLFAIMSSKSAGEVLNGPFIGAYILAAIIGFMLWAVLGRMLFRTSLSEASLFGLSASYGNIGFMAVPLLTVAMGEAAAVPVALILMVDLVILVPLGVMLVEMGEGEENTWAHAWASIIRTLTRNPLVVSIFLGLAVGLSGIPLPGPVDGFARFLGSAAAPAAMFTLGAALSRRSASEGLGQAAYMTIGKLGVYPILVWGVMVAVGVDVFWLKVAVVSASMPIAANLFVMAEQYDVYPQATSTAILISTAISMMSLTALLILF